jgi:hypothetical protein
MTDSEGICQWCGSENVQMRKYQVRVDNAQMDVPHMLYICADCRMYSLVAWFGNRCSIYRAIEKWRFLLPNIYIIIYPIACAWCGADEQMQPVDINATIGNPMTRRHRYDVYMCLACECYTAVSYLGELATYAATQDNIYSTLYYLNIEDT